MRTPFPEIEVGQKFMCGRKRCEKISETQFTDGKTIVIGSIFSEFEVIDEA